MRVTGRFLFWNSRSTFVVVWDSRSATSWSIRLLIIVQITHLWKPLYDLAIINSSRGYFLGRVNKSRYSELYVTQMVVQSLCHSILLYIMMRTKNRVRERGLGFQCHASSIWSFYEKIWLQILVQFFRFQCFIRFLRQLVK